MAGTLSEPLVRITPPNVRIVLSRINGLVVRAEGFEPPAWPLISLNVILTRGPRLGVPPVGGPGDSDPSPPRPSLFRRILVRLLSALGRRPCRRCGAIERRKVRTGTGSFTVCGNCWGRP